MRQLILDLLPATPPSLDNFVPGGNGETLAAFTGWLAGEHLDPSFCLWGEPGSGKSHLLQASGFDYVDAGSDPDLAAAPESDQLAVDRVESLSPEGQITLFNHFNRLRMGGGRLLTAVPQPPAHLGVREDLRTRLGSGLIYRLLPLSDGEKADALAAQARERALKMAPEAINYLLRHAPRDMRILSGIIVALDRYSLEHKRPITLPLLREVLLAPLETQ
jgi:DnaA family protein